MAANIERGLGNEPGLKTSTHSNAFIEDLMSKLGATTEKVASKSDERDIRKDATTGGSDSSRPSGESTKANQLSDAFAQLNAKRDTSGWDKAISILPTTSLDSSWLTWSKAQRSLSVIVDPAATSKEKREELKSLSENAKGGDPYAKASLVGVLLSDGKNDIASRWSAQLQGEVSGKPLFLPSQTASSATDSTTLELRTHAAKTLTNLALTAQDVSAIALQAAREQSTGSRELASLLTRAIEQPDTQQRHNVADGLVLASQSIEKISTQKNDSSNLAELYIKVASPLDRERNLPDFLKMAATGNKPAIEVLANVLAMPGDKRDMDSKARNILEALSADPQLRPLVIKALLDVNQKHGDADQLLATLGTVASKDAQPSADVRNALYRGLESETVSVDGSRKQASAVAGMIAFADRWNSTDANTFGRNLTPASIAALNKNSEVLNRDIQKELLQIARAKLESNDTHLSPDKTKLALELLSTFASHAGRAELKTLSGFSGSRAPQTAPETRQLAAGALLRIGQSSNDQQTQSAAFDRFNFSSWGPLVPQRDKPLMVAYAKGEQAEISQPLERVAYEARLQQPESRWFQQVFQSAETAMKTVFEKVSPGTVGDTTTRTTGSTNDATSPAGDVPPPAASPEQQARDVGARIILLNSMPPSLRKELTASESPIDAQAAIQQLKEGTLKDGSYSFLLTDVSKKLLDLKQSSQQSENNLRADIEKLTQDKLRTSERLNEHTSQGVSLLDRINIFEDKVGDFDRKQSKLVEKVRDIERKIEEKNKTLEWASGRSQLIDLYCEVDEHTRLMQQGKVKEADQKALEMWGKHGEVLKQVAPTVWGELEGPGTNGSNVFQRLKASGEVVNERLPQTGEGTADGFKIGTTLLTNPGDPGLKDTAAVRQRALGAIDADPTLGSLAQQTRKLGEELQVLQGMVKSGMEGSKFETFCKDARERAGEVKKAMEAIEPQLPAIKQQLEELKRTQNQTTDEAAKEELKKRIEGFEEALTLFDPKSDTNKQLKNLLQIVDSPKFDADTFFNWLKREGAVVGFAIACAVSAGIAVGTCGIGSPLLAAVAIAGASSGAMLAGQEVAKEALFHANIGLGDGSRSRVGQLVAGEKVIDQATGKERDMSLLGDVILPYGQQWGVDFTVMLATMGTGALLGKGANMCLAKLGESRAVAFVSRNADALRQMASSSSKVEATIAANGHQPWQKEFVKEFGGEVFEEVKEQGTEEMLQNALGKGNTYLGFAASVLLAAGKHTKLSLLKGPDGGITEIRVPSTTELNTVVEQLSRDGFQVEGDGSSFKVNVAGKDLLVAMSQGDSHNEAQPVESKGDQFDFEGARLKTAQRKLQLEESYRQLGVQHIDDLLMDTQKMNAFMESFSKLTPFGSKAWNDYLDVRQQMTSDWLTYDDKLKETAREQLIREGNPAPTESEVAELAVDINKEVRDNLDLHPELGPLLVKYRETKVRLDALNVESDRIRETAMANIRKVVNDFTRANGLPDVQVAIGLDAQMQGASGMYGVGKGDLLLNLYDLLEQSGSKTMAKVLYHELTHHSQGTLIFQWIKQEVDAKFPVEERDSADYRYALKDRFKEVTNSQLDNDSIHFALRAPQRTLTPAEIDRAKALAESFSKAPRNGDIGGKVRYERDFTNRLTTRTKAADRIDTCRIFNEIKNDPQLREIIFGTSELNSIPTEVLNDIQAFSSANFDAEQARVRLMEHLEGRREALAQQMRVIIDQYEGQLHENEAFLAHEAFDLAVETAGQSSVAAEQVPAAGSNTGSSTSTVLVLPTIELSQTA